MGGSRFQNQTRWNPSHQPQCIVKPNLSISKKPPWPLTRSRGNTVQENAFPETIVSHATNHKQRKTATLRSLAVRQEAKSTPRPCPFSVTLQCLTLPGVYFSPHILSHDDSQAKELEWGKGPEDSYSLQKPIRIQPWGYYAYPLPIPAAVNFLDTIKSTSRKKQSFLIRKDWRKAQLVKTKKGLSLILTIPLFKKKEPGVEVHTGEPQAGRWRQLTSSPA